MKANWKSFSIVCVLLLAVVLTLNAIDLNNINASGENLTGLKVTVVDLEGKTVHNAKITVSGSTTSFFTDNKGKSPVIEVPVAANWYDSSITQWFCVNVTVEKNGYVNTLVAACVIYKGEVRNLSVTVYKVDDSALPYVCYVESPPSEYIESLFGKVG